mgnify:CR=1 FL=1
MDELLRDIGIFSIVLVLLYSIKKIYDNIYFQSVDLYEDNEDDIFMESLATWMKRDLDES